MQVRGCACLCVCVCVGWGVCICVCVCVARLQKRLSMLCRAGESMQVRVCVIVDVCVKVCDRG
jgi:hypothetical protein